LKRSNDGFSRTSSGFDKTHKRIGRNVTFEELVDFVDRRMRMSHVYQPIMLKALLSQDGECTEEEIARSLLQYDRSQVEYYERITRNMVGKVLRNHDIVKRDRPSKSYTLNDFELLTQAHIEALLAKCDEKLAQFMQARGDQPWSHRRNSSGYISGTLRYEVLKAAKYRCELCGVAADEKALEVDHIVPRNHGGSDDLSNLQALCYSCNAMKRDRDDTDFRKVREEYEIRMPDCPFCLLDNRSALVENELAVAVRDAYPVTEGHSLVIPRRHVESFFDLGAPEIKACTSLLAGVRNDCLEKDDSITGFNIGVNDGSDSGQTVFHCHWHLIPRRSGDVDNPRGGVRNTIPGMGDY
jgi:ATP adenylyltransferase